MNERTARKAAIRRAAQQARRRLENVDEESQARLAALYRSAADDLRRQIREYADGEGNLRTEVLDSLLRQVEQRLEGLTGQVSQTLTESLQQAAELGAGPWAAEAGRMGLTATRLATDAARFVQEFQAADGLQLSDRLWRLERGGKEVIGQAIQRNVLLGNDASRAAREFLERGERVPAEILDRLGLASADSVGQVAGRQLLTGEGAPYYNAKRLFRTEINRAHGEAYRGGVAAHPDTVGVRFLLSPGHPTPDICDLHASANLHGLGSGVYPVDQSPWPAHPNTLSFEEVVFDDEVSEQDRSGRQERLDWIAEQPAAVQDAVLGGENKGRAFRDGQISEGMIATPWRVVKQRLEQRGYTVDE